MMEVQSNGVIEEDTLHPDQSESKISKVKHDWYQTEAYVNVSILIKNVDPDTVQVKYGPQELDVKTEEHEFKLNLLHEINPSDCHYRVTSTKIEVRLAKVTGEKWSTLEQLEHKEVPKPAKQSPNWDRFVKEIPEEEPQGEAALNAMFQKIYGDSSEEVRRAMNKSYIESGGTVLSTNWNEVGKDKVPIRPPDGVEFRKWDS